MAQGNGPIVVGVDGSAPVPGPWSGRPRRPAPKSWTSTWWSGGTCPSCWGCRYPCRPTSTPSTPARDVLEEAQQTVAANYPDLVVKTHVVEGPAARALVRTAADVGASLLVVGARGHGEVTGLLIGSVSENVATHAKCPVVVVRH